MKSIEESRKFYENVLGFECYRMEEVEDQKVKTAFFQIGETKIELLESTSEDGPIAKFIEKRGEGIHHLAFHAENINGALNEAASKGVRLIDEKSRKGAEGLDIGFLHPKSTGGVLMELCENNQKEE